MTPDRPSFNSQYFLAFSVFSGLVSAMSVISLAVKYFEVGLVPIAAQFVAYYRSIIAFFLDPILAFLPFRVPAWYRDAFVISRMLLTLNVRSQQYLTRNYGILYDDGHPNPNLRFVLESLHAIIMFIIAAFVLYGLLLLPILAYYAFSVKRQERQLLGNWDRSQPWPVITNTKFEALRYYFTYLAAIIVASLAFFATNAFSG